MGERKCTVLIVSHGRPQVRTVKTLLKQGYTGDWWIVLDDEDGTRWEYERNYPGHIVTFDKQKYIDYTDTMTQKTGDNRCVVFARNACWDIAADLGCTHFIVLDDDYSHFAIRWAADAQLKCRITRELDDIFEAYLDYLDESDAAAVCMGQGGDLIGGVGSGTWRKQVVRKMMNVYFLRTDRRFDFIGKLNEDATTAALLGSQGQVFLTNFDCIVVQGVTQQNAGGLTEIYKSQGTYVKSFYSVMACPSFVKISKMGDKHLRVHHFIDRRYGEPKILSSRWRKGEEVCEWAELDNQST